MMKASDALLSAWMASTAEAGTLPGNYFRRLPNAGPLTIYGGVEAPGNLRTLSIRLPTISAGDASRRDSTHGYVITEESEPDGEVLVHIREIGSLVPKDLFLIFCSDVVEHVAASLTIPQAVRALDARLRQWRRFFQSRGEEGLTRERYVGLYAELDFLERCLDAAVSIDLIVGAWSGPLGTNQDYLF